MIYQPKKHIRLSHSLYAQTTPYPNAGKTIKRATVVFVLLVIVGIFWFSRAHDPNRSAPQSGTARQILGEQSQNIEYSVYIVRQGDTLFTISQRLGISWEALAEINNLQAPYTLKIGEQINTP